MKRLLAKKGPVDVKLAYQKYLNIIVIFSLIILGLDAMMKNAVEIVDFLIGFFMWVEVLLGALTYAAWFADNVLAVSFSNLLEKIPDFDMYSVRQVWKLYHAAWLQYACNVGVFLAILIIAQRLIL